MSESPSENWKRWIAEYGSRLLLFARQQTRSNEDAEDVLQEAIMNMWNRLGGSVDPPDLPLAYATIRRRAIDLARRDDRRRRREDISMETSDHFDSIEPWFAIDDKETAAKVEAAVKSLPEKFREVVTLKIWGELTFAQIAEALNIPMNTAASRYRYGLEHLRSKLSPPKL